MKEKKETPFLGKTFTNIDLSFLTRISGGDNVFVKDVISSFLETAPPIVDAIRLGLSESNSFSISQSIHKVKPSLTMLGLVKTKELGDYLEAELTTGDLTDYLRQGVFKFCDEVSHAINELTS